MGSLAIVGSVIGAFITDSWDFGVFGVNKHSAVHDLANLQDIPTLVLSLLNPEPLVGEEVSTNESVYDKKHLSLKIMAAGEGSLPDQFVYYTIIINNDGNVSLNSVNTIISIPNGEKSLSTFILNSSSASIQPKLVFLENSWMRDGRINFGYLNPNQTIELHFAIQMNKDVSVGIELRTYIFLNATEIPNWETFVFSTEVGQPLPNNVVVVKQNPPH